MFEKCSELLCSEARGSKVVGMSLCLASIESQYHSKKFHRKGCSKSVRNSSARKRAVLRLYVGLRVWYQIKACKVVSSFIIRDVRRTG
jgi:hypothetical protein